MYTQKTIEAVIDECGDFNSRFYPNEAVVRLVLEALESTAEQKALRADAERLNKLQDLFIKGEEFHIVMCAGENDDEECEHDAHPHFEAFDWSWRCEAVRSNTLRDVIDQAIDKARHD